MDKVPALQFAGWMACLFFAVGGFNQFSKAWRNLRGETPQPGNQELGIIQHDLRERIEKNDSELNDFRTQHLRDRETDRQLATGRSAGIYKKIDDIYQQLNEKIDESERRMLEKQDKLPERIIALLNIQGSHGRSRQ